MQSSFRTLATILAAALLGACGGSSGGIVLVAPTNSIAAPAVDLMVMVGATVDITYTDNDTDSPATSEILADIDGDLGTVADQVDIGGGALPHGGGAAQTVTWDTTGVPPGVYRIYVRTGDGGFVVLALAAGTITINAVAEVLPADAADLVSTAGRIRFRFAAPVAAGTFDATTMPVTVAAAPVPGAYSVENGNEVVFTPTAGIFDAGVTVTREVRSDVGTTTSAPAPVSTTTFTTNVSPVYAYGHRTGLLDVVDIIGLTSAPITLDATDRPVHGVGSSAGTIFLANRQASTVIVVDSATNTVTNRIAFTPEDGAMMQFVQGVRLSPDEQTLYVTIYEGANGNDDTAVGYLAVVDVATETELGRVLLSSPGRLRDVAVSPDNARAFVPNYGGLLVHVIDLATRTEIDTDGDGANGITPMPTAAGGPSGTAVSLDGTRLYVSHSANFSGASQGDTLISVFDLVTLTAMPRLAATATAVASSAAIAIDPVRNQLWVPRIAYSLNNGMSIYDLTVDPPVETVVTVVSGGNDDNRTVVFVDGTDLAVMQERDSGTVRIFDRTDPATQTTVLLTPSRSGVAAIPARNY